MVLQRDGHFLSLIYGLLGKTGSVSVSIFLFGSMTRNKRDTVGLSI